MKNFQITAKGKVSNYIKENAIKAKSEISNVAFLGPGRDASCFWATETETSKGLSVAM